MTTAWLVEQGEYSGYHIVGVFSSRENAQLVADAINANKSSNAAAVVEYPLDPVVHELRQGYRFYLLEMLRDGTVDACHLEEISTSDLAGDALVVTRSHWPPGQKRPEALRARVWATDDTHAIKIVNETRLQLIANNEWPAP